MAEPLLIDVWQASFDELYRKSDRLYYRLARECDLSESAYWVMYVVYVGGGEAPVATLTEEHNFSKQTVNSALRQLKEKGLVTTEFCEGSRKSKRVIFTEEGREFAEQRIAPASQVERRAFNSLDPDERQEMIRLINKYVKALDAELACSGKA